MSTPTLVRRISSSISRLRLTLVKKTRPPSSLMGRAGLLPCRRNVPALFEAVGDAALRERFPVFLADERVLHPVRNGGSAVGNVDRGVVGVFCPRRAGIAAGVVRAEPGGEAERVFRYAEVLVVPARAAGSGAHHPDRLVVDALHFVHAAVLPRRDAQPLGPGVGVALALHADEHRGRGVRVSLRVAAVLLPARPGVEAVGGPGWPAPPP